MKRLPDALNSGDINLTASLMSMGVPLKQDDPCSLILRDNGRNYATFYVEGRTIDGQYLTKDLMHQWKQKDSQNQSFVTLMEFVKFSKGAVKTHELMDAANEFIKERNEGADFPMPTDVDDIPDMVAASPDALESYVLAFVYNRNHIWEIIKATRRRRIMMTEGNNHGMIDSDLPKWKRNEILARMED